MERAVPVLPVENLAQAKRFYVDGLGFEVTFEVCNDDGSGLMGVKRGSIAITLDCPMSGHGRDARQSETVAQGARPARVILRRVRSDPRAIGRRPSGRSERFPAAAPPEALRRSLKGDQGLDDRRANWRG